MSTIPRLIAEQRKELDNFVFAVSYKQNGTEIVDFDYHADEREMPKKFYTTSLISLISLIDALMEEEKAKMREISKTPFFKTPAQDSIDIAWNEAKQDTLSRLQAIKDELMK